MTDAANQAACPRLSSKGMAACTEYEIARQTFQAMRRYFAQPGVRAEFDAWKARRDAERGEQP